MSDVPLMGFDHEAALRRLCDAYSETLREWRPRMVSITAETGVGKTRVVQEFYRRIAVSDPYWPAVLTAPNQRKAVVPVKSSWLGEPRLLWLGLSCWQQPNGRPGPALDSALPRQLRAHARGLLVREHRTKAAKDLLIKGATAIVPFIGAESVKSIIETLGQVAQAREIAIALQRIADRGDVEVDQNVVDAVVELAELVNADGIPMVIVIDDAHDADTTTLAAIDRLMESARGVLVIATAWPTAIERQRADADGFGHWLEGVATTRRIERHELQLLRCDELTTLAEVAVRNRGPGAVDRAVTRLLAERAGGNPMLLAHLLDLAWVNGMTLGAEDMPEISLLPSEPALIFREVWTRFLPADIQRTLQAAAVLGTPIHEKVLSGAVEVMSVKGDSAIAQAMTMRWLAPVPDPYTDDVSIRFTEPFLREVAESSSAELLRRTQASLIRRALLETLALPSATSDYARTKALEHAVRLIEHQTTPAVPAPVTADVLSKLADLLWRRDRRRAAELLDRAVHIYIDTGGQPPAPLLISAAQAHCNLDRVDAGLTILELGGVALLAVKAYFGVSYERWNVAIEAARLVVVLEFVRPGVILLPPLSEGSLILDVALIVCEAGMMAQNTDVVAAARSLLTGITELLTIEARMSEATVVLEYARELDPQEPTDDAIIDLGSESLSSARQFLAEGRFDAAADSLNEVVLHADARRGAPLARVLVERAGPCYAKLLRRISFEAGDFKLAARGSQLAIKHHKLTGTAADDRQLQAERWRLAEALAAVGKGELAARVAKLSLRIATRAQEPTDIARALIAAATAHVALGEFQKAEEALCRADMIFRDERSDKQWPYPDERVVRLLCDVHGLQNDWQGLRDTLQTANVLTFSPYWRAGLRMMAWRDVARWHENRQAFERELTATLGLGELAEPDATWVRNAVGHAMVRVEAGLQGLGAPSFPVDRRFARDWLGVTLAAAGRADDVARLKSLHGISESMRRNRPHDAD